MVTNANKGNKGKTGNTEKLKLRHNVTLCEFGIIGVHHGKPCGMKVDQHFM